MAMWNLLGERPAEMVAWESFGAGWVTDVVKQLKIKATTGCTPLTTATSWIMAALNYDNDVCFTWNGTTSGVRLPSGDVIPADRAGLTLVRCNLSRLRDGPAVGQVWM